MVSINSAARYSIAALRTINEELATTQNRISSGYRINSAKDNPTVWAVATSIRSQLKSYDTVNASLATAKANIDSAASAADTITTALNDMNTKLAEYKAAGSADAKTLVFNQIVDLQNQITAALTVSGGTNLLDNTTGYSFASSVGAGGAVGSTSFTPTDLKTVVSATAIDSAGSPTITTFLTTFTQADMGTTAKMTLITTAVTGAVTSASTYAAKLGSASTQVASLQKFNKTMSSIQETALSSMVDADLEEESAKLQALQTKQQLAYQTLSMANSSGQNILRLFQ